MKNPLSKIECLKRKAKSAYLGYLNTGGDLDCGLSLASYINPEIEQYKREFNAIMDELAAIDPTTPTTRL